MAAGHSTLSDLSELEVELGPLAAAGAARKVPGSRFSGRAPAVAAVAALLGAAALAVVLLAIPAAGPRAAAGPTADAIRAYALAHGGHALTEAEVARVQLHLARVRGAARGRLPRGLRPRILEEEGEDSDHDHAGEEGEHSDHDHDHAGEGDVDSDHDHTLSEECETACREMGEDMLEKYINRSMAVSTACEEDEHCKACTDANEALDSLEEDMKQECKEAGAMCSMTEVLPEGTETEEACVPKACHQHEHTFQCVAEHLMEEAHEDCEDCSVTVKCGDGK